MVATINVLYLLISIFSCIQGLGFNRPKKIKKVTVPPSAEEKQKYIDGALNYADYLMKELGSEEGI